MTKQTRIGGTRLLACLITSYLLCGLALFDAGRAVAGEGAYEVSSTAYLGKARGAEKLSAPLRALLAAAESRGLASRGAGGLAAAALSNRLVHVNGAGAVQVYVYLASSNATAIGLIQGAGASIEVVNEELGIAQAWVPLARLGEIARLGVVRRVTAPGYAFTRAGSVVTEGDAILNADDLRALGFSGGGTKVGVISDGVDNRASSQASGDLPNDVTIQTHAGSGDEGTAMLEIVHDLAPAAGLAFCGPDTSLDMIECVNDLADQFGADVIVDDLGFFNEPFFEDGPIAQAVAGVAAAGKIYASSAGNEADVHYQGSYVDSGNAFHSHDFGGGDTTIHIRGRAGQAIVLLQWTNPFGGSGDDYDLCLTDAEGTTRLLCSDDTQDGNDDPAEALVLNCGNPGGCDGEIQIERASGSAQTLEMYFFSTEPTEHVVAGDSIFGHPCANGAIAVGAIDASDPGNDTIEPFSSQGPCTMISSSALQARATETRQKPEVAAIDGVSVTGAGDFPSTFFGTSASAPHVAGVAALLKGGFTTGQEVFDALQDSAVDLGTPGFDPAFGSGRVDALAAAQILNDAPDGAIDSPAADVQIDKGGTVAFAGTCTDSNSTTGMTAAWTFGAGSGVADSTSEDPGAVVYSTAGTFQASLTCRDGFGKADPSPAIRTVTVRKPKSGGGGGCSIEGSASGRSPSDWLAGVLGLLAVAALWKAAIRRDGARPAGRVGC